MLKIIPWLLLLSSSTVFANTTAKPSLDELIENDKAAFPKCLASLETLAKQKGISQSVIDSHLLTVRFTPKVIDLDNRQPEFTQTFAGYFNKRVSQWRIEKGQELLVTHHDLLMRLKDKYGVQPQYILAFWGLETNYGTYKGNMSTLDSLATLACNKRRSQFFTQELMIALELSERYGFAASEMQGSWAGAVGHTQFMPSNYAAYAVDGDNDGKVDLWNSIDDALTSAANFLNKLGWQRGERWGREVVVPATFNYSHLGEKKSLSQWQALNITRANGQSLPQADMNARLYVPAGHMGPAFLGYDNFNVTMRWNRSEFYAISVGRLADRIVGAAPLVHTPPEQAALNRTQIKTLQLKLTALGFDTSGADGILGSNSRAAIQAFQSSKGFIADGFPSQETLTALGL